MSTIKTTIKSKFKQFYEAFSMVLGAFLAFLFIWGIVVSIFFSEDQEQVIEQNGFTKVNTYFGVHIWFTNGKDISAKYIEFYTYNEEVYRLYKKGEKVPINVIPKDKVLDVIALPKPE